MVDEIVEPSLSLDYPKTGFVAKAHLRIIGKRCWLL
jgi:hypothetical protein